jgi:hypothetical protein
MYTKLQFKFTKTSEYNKLCKQVEKLVGKDPVFEFSIMDSSESQDGFYVNHPDLDSKEPVIKGKIQFNANYWRINETGSVSTPILENPTWKDILTATNNLLEENDAGGIFLEALVVTDKSNGITQVELEFGS